MTANSTHGMGLRSFVALPVEKAGGVMRLSMEENLDSDNSALSANLAYGFSSKQTLLLGIPYQISPSENNRWGDVSALYRHNLFQDDRQSGTERFSLLAGMIIPTANGRNLSTQAGFVYTLFINRYELDLDALYQKGLDNQPDTGRYDVSWQYRLFPTDYPNWGITNELYSVLELNGRWHEGDTLTHQVTAGLQWINQKFVIEGGIIKDINNEHDVRYVISTRFHF